MPPPRKCRPSRAIPSADCCRLSTCGWHCCVYLHSSARPALSLCASLWHTEGFEATFLRSQGFPFAYQSAHPACTCCFALRTFCCRSRVDCCLPRQGMRAALRRALEGAPPPSLSFGSAPQLQSVVRGPSLFSDTCVGQGTCRVPDYNLGLGSFQRCSGTIGRCTLALLG